eukprot:1175761-Prorocentrum_minimum.AAC.2
MLPFAGAKIRAVGQSDAPAAPAVAAAPAPAPPGATAQDPTARGGYRNTRCVSAALYRTLAD